MGRAVLRLAAQDERFRVTAALSEPTDLRLGYPVGPIAGVELDLFVVAEPQEPCDVLIEFTTPLGCATWAEWCAAHGTALVSGTTGLGPEHHEAVERAARRVPVLWAPNMSAGVNLLLHLVREAVRRLDADWDIEITETHHRQKRDAPSGTAYALLEAISAARQGNGAAPVRYGRGPQADPRQTGEIGIHSIRLGGLVGRHEVQIGSQHEVIALRHEALSRDAFAAGALRAAHFLLGKPPGLYTMVDVLEEAPCKVQNTSNQGRHEAEQKGTG